MLENPRKYIPNQSWECPLELVKEEETIKKQLKISEMRMKDVQIIKSWASSVY